MKGITRTEAPPGVRSSLHFPFLWESCDLILPRKAIGNKCPRLNERKKVNVFPLEQGWESGREFGNREGGITEHMGAALITQDTNFWTV